MTPQHFIAKWRRSNLSERSACQQHFLDICELLDQPKPAEADPDGTWYTFEKGVQKTEGGQGWADVWMRDHFGWEYKGKHKDLKEAYSQLLLYREDLENPPLLVVCDMDRFEVHTNFTGTAKQVHVFDLAGLADPANLDVLRRLFTDPNSLRPGITSEKITVEAAERFAKLADGMRLKGIEPLRAAHFLMRLMFCMFGEDTGLLPAGLFRKLLDTAKANFAMLPRLLQTLFDAMAHGGTFGSDVIAWFNGGLFADTDVIPLTRAEISTLADITKYDWASVEPSIFGTLFERTLDPSKRSQIGAHYTSRKDIETLLVPVLLAPLRGEWGEVKRRCEDDLWPKVVKASRARSGSVRAKDSPQRKAFDRALLDFVQRLAHVAVLDPACGSGNFLYVAIHMLLDLEKEVIAYAATRGLSLVPHVNPSQLHGLEVNPYAQQLAQVVIWIGYLQWMHHNGFKMPDHPVLAPIESIRCMDAILDLSDPEHPKEPEWPEAEFIVGNPPFLGGNRIRQGLGDDYVARLFRLYDGRVPGFADLCCYWFEKARDRITRGKASRVGLLATQSVRGGANREVLKRIKETGDIFFAISDRDWINEGASVHVSLVGFDAARETSRELDGIAVKTISADLTTGVDVTAAKQLAVMQPTHLEGVKKGADFQLQDNEAMEMLSLPNPNGRPNSDVIRPYFNGADMLGGEAAGWIVYYPPSLTCEDASLYEAPFERVKAKVFPKYGAKRSRWWLHERPRPEMADMLRNHQRYLATVKHSKHRLFVWQPTEVLVSNAVEFFSRSDDYFAGVLQSLVHEVWARRQATQVRERDSGLRYTPSSCFETFPFPEATAQKQAEIAIASNELFQRRNAWLNPPEWTKTEVLEFPGSVDGPWGRYVAEPNARGIGTVRWPRTVPRDADCAASLGKRTLTNLYNRRPAWLDLAHKKLDEAVLAAYGWDAGISDENLLAKLLELNLEHAGRALEAGKSPRKRAT